MVDKKSKKRTQVKDLPKKDKKLSAGDMKKVKGGDQASGQSSGKRQYEPVWGDPHIEFKTDGVKK